MMGDYTINYKIRWLDKSDFSDEHTSTLFGEPSYVIKIMLALMLNVINTKEWQVKIDSGSWVKAGAP
jgi:hypothetical protein